MRVSDLGSIGDLESPIDPGAIATARGLTLHRLLFNAYEQSMLFLPERPLSEADYRAMAAFYDPALVAMGQQVRPALERAAFGALDAYIEASGPWDLGSLIEYLQSAIHEYEQSPSSLVAAIEATPRPRAALLYLLVQQAPDFLSEASAMARAMLGRFGPAQSELMKVFIDEYGYGVHERKHSTLFAACMRSVGLSDGVHDYYFHYLASSLALVNYFHCVCANKQAWFRYLGALYFTEASIPHFNRQLSRALRRAFGATVDTSYFDEHVHIDKHHRSMVLEALLAPAVRLYGPTIIPEVLAGFEAFRHLQEVADLDYLEQVAFADGLAAEATSGPALRGRRPADEPLTFEEPEGELSYSHVHDADELFTVERGRLEMYAGLEPVVLEAGASIVIPAGRLHGTRVVDGACTYRVQELASP
ncbi:iron-containing redox enzyme family protein [Nannocystis sp. ILAH1]|uniref:iron-containing redox enzyme family protein n=1 Tax=unclassified Nannocystis TaxID=2627009 RepID=UPI00226DEBD8|nr:MULTISPECIES: iron-containing redox enzyme family protein [unclassified Nannocystis]MCY0994765.1 iron-containing redox enzyme family protein [Nannocystis sp. ILAH1]MCY1065368.1 iron-containing redox enzyme family protein [Nannocystis sp. RBIL2]